MNPYPSVKSASVPLCIRYGEDSSGITEKNLQAKAGAHSLRAGTPSEAAIQAQGQHSPLRGHGRTENSAQRKAAIHTIDVYGRAPQNLNPPRTFELDTCQLRAYPPVYGRVPRTRTRCRAWRRGVCTVRTNDMRPMVGVLLLPCKKNVTLNI